MPRAHAKTSSSTSGRRSSPDFGMPSDKALKPVDVRDVQPERARVELFVCSSSAPGRDESRASAQEGAASAKDAEASSQHFRRLSSESCVQPAAMRLRPSSSHEVPLRLRS
eukprot:scaffold37707_cov69-Phaeocystis_antarctica.AAC.1